MAWRRVALALLLVQVVSAVQFYNLFGKFADPCAIGLYGEGARFPAGSGLPNGPTLTVSPPNCILANRPTTVPQSSATIVLPSQNPAYGTNLVATITGRNFRTFGAGNPVVTFYLGQPTQDPAQYCTEDVLAAPGPIAEGQVQSDTVILLNIPLNTWASQGIELESSPRPICIARLTPDATVSPTINPGGVWTGFLSGAVFDCNFNDRQCGTRDVDALPVDALRRADIRTRTFCCRNTDPRFNIGILATAGQFAGATLANLTIGQCINVNVQSCCGGSAIVNTVEKCCNPFIETTQFIDGRCICRGNADCLAPATNPAVGALAENTCCRATRFSNVFTGDTADVLAITGTCYNPANARCCDTGDAYDPGSLQCCPINGLQTLELPCPCNIDSDCTDINTAATHRCCRQGTPNLQQLTTATCSRFTNYPLGGPIPPQAARCLGTCYDVRFGICCNGATCIREVENCCNNTCCNRFTQGCFKARGQGSATSLFATNSLNFKEVFARCSSIEFLDSVRVFWFAVLPALLLAASFLGLALALVFVNKASARRTSFLEVSLIVFAVITFLLALPLYFAPVYKYGIVTAFAAIVAILAAGVRVRWLNAFAIIFLAIAVIYVIDPFWGNAWLTLASDRVHFGGSNGNGGFANPFIVGTTDVRTSGVLHATNFMFDDRDASVSPLLRRCVRFYDYFVVDRDLYDFARIDNPDIQTFGYCSRAWVIGLLYIEGLIILFLLVTFILAVLALIVRFRKLRFEPIELEVRGVEPGIVY